MQYYFVSACSGLKIVITFLDKGSHVVILQGSDSASVLQTDALSETVFMFESLTSLAATTCDALIMPTHSTWNIACSLSRVVNILIFKSFEKTPAPVLFYFEAVRIHEISFVSAINCL